MLKLFAGVMCIFAGLFMAYCLYTLIDQSNSLRPEIVFLYSVSFSNFLVLAWKWTPEGLAEVNKLSEASKKAKAARQKDRLEDDERPRRGRSREEDEDEDERPRRRRPRDDEEEDEDEDRPRRRARVDEDAPRRRRRDEDEE